VYVLSVSAAAALEATGLQQAPAVVVVRAVWHI